jgi:GT2 family glycosyltransferase
MKKNIKLSIVIVDFKSGAYLTKLLKALPKRTDWEVTVIDNAKKNLGFGGGCNAGAMKASGKYLLFLNPDVLIKEKDIRVLIAYLDKHEDIGVVGPKFINALGKTEPCCIPHPTPLTAAVALSFINKYFPHNTISDSYWVNDWNRETTREMPAISGAALMVRASEFRKLGMFDEEYFLYWEEFDLCRRYSLAGFKNAHVAEATAYHPREISMKKSKLNLREISRESRKRYFTKYYGPIVSFLLDIWLR